MVRLSIIIVNWNSGKYLEQCLRSIFKNKPRFSFEIVVVDNNSTDQSLKSIEKYHTWIEIIRNPTNMGLSKANNIGINKTTGKYILFLNPDTEILPETLNKIVRYFEEHKKIGALGPKLLNINRSVQTSCHGFITLAQVLFEISTLDKLFPKNRVNKLILGKFLGSIFSNLLANYKEYNKITKVNVVMGSCFLTSRATLEDVGYFDEHFFLYHEENELCYRLWKKGLNCIYFPKVSVIHYNKQSTSKIPEIVFFERCKSLLYYFRKHYSKRVVSFKIIAMFAMMINILIGLIFNKKKKGVIKNRLHILAYLLRN